MDKKKINKIVILNKSSIKDAMIFLNKNQEKFCLVKNHNHKIIGSITDGDLRRALEKNNPESWGELTAKNIMTNNPITIDHENKAIDALNLMEKNNKKPVNVMPVTKSNNEFMGFIRLHDLIQRGL